MTNKPPLPPFNKDSAIQKIRMAEDAWNTRDPDKIVQVYTHDTQWRNRNEFPVGRDEVHAFLTRKWQQELDYRLIKELWAYTCLLYTSPSPRDLSTSRMPSSA